MTKINKADLGSLLGSGVIFLTFIHPVLPGRRNTLRKLYKENGLYVLKTNTLMLDWDLPGLGHYSCEAITIATRYEPVAILQNLCNQSDAWLFRVYKTPGGVRAFCMSHAWDITNPVEASVARMLMSTLRCDPCYIDFTFRKGSGWASRVSPKPVRKDDYVARHILDIGKGVATKVNAANVAIHDNLIPQFIRATKVRPATPKPILK